MTVSQRNSTSNCVEVQYIRIHSTAGCCSAGVVGLFELAAHSAQADRRTGTSNGGAGREGEIGGTKKWATREKKSSSPR